MHERFTVRAGSERVVEQLHHVFPDAPVYAPICDRSTLLPGLGDADIRTGALQRFFRGNDRYAHLLPLLPGWFARLDLSVFDLVVTSHHAFANRVRPPAGVPVISYTHTPARWMWDASMRDEEIGGRVGRAGLAAFSATQRRADRASADRAALVVVNSTAVQQRVRSWWNLSSTVVAPPVDIARFTPDPSIARESFFLNAGRLVPYKRPDVAVAAARAAGVPIVVAGEGRFEARVAKLAGVKAEMLGAVDDDTLVDLLRRCRALLQPGLEDFGILAVEAQACGTPVVACDAEGALDTVVDGITGRRYRVDGDPVARLAAVLRAFDPDDFDPAAIRAHAESFRPERFRDQMAALVDGVARNRG